MDIGSEVIDPDFLGLHLRAGGLFVEEDDICLNAGLIEDAGGQPEDGVQIGSLEQLLSDSLACAALEQHIIWHHNSGSAGSLQNAVF